MSKASDKEMEELHAILVQELIKKVRSGECTAADLNVARQMLKDNNIQSTGLPGTPIRDLAASLPFAGEVSGEHTYQ